MSIRRSIRIGLGLAGFAFLVITIAIVGFNPMCGEEMGTEKTSPDGLYVAQFMTRNCGATTRYVSHINLRPTRSKFHSDFWSGAISDGEIFTSSEVSDVRFCWSKPHKLSMDYPGLRVRHWREVTIDDNFRNPECQ
jgi:hypothetical protein